MLPALSETSLKVQFGKSSHLPLVSRGEFLSLSSRHEEFAFSHEGSCREF